MSGMWTALECRPSPTQSWLPRFVKSVSKLGFEHDLNTNVTALAYMLQYFGISHDNKALSCSSSNCHIVDQVVLVA